MKKQYQPEFMKKYRNLHETENSKDFENALDETITCDGEMSKLFTIFNQILTNRRKIRKYGSTRIMNSINSDILELRKSLDKIYFQFQWIKKCGDANSRFKD